MSFGATDRTAFFIFDGYFPGFWEGRQGFRCVPVRTGHRYPSTPTVAVRSQAASRSCARAMRLPISSALAVWMPKNIHRVSVALVRARIRLSP